MKKKIWNVGYSEIEDSCLLSKILNDISVGRKSNAAFVNPHTEVSISKNIKLINKINSFDYVLCDGVGVELLSKAFKDYKINRTPGPALFKELSSRLNKPENIVTYFFLGSTDEVLDLIKIKMTKYYPSVEVVGVYSPPMGEFDTKTNNYIVDVINKSEADVLWVGMTAPKQEEWIVDHLSRLNVKFAAGIGAEFDYFAGKKKRPPEWISKIGMQWFHRLITQPKIWKRTFVSTPLFLINVLVFWLKTKGIGKKV